MRGRIRRFGWLRLSIANAGHTCLTHSKLARVLPQVAVRVLQLHVRFGDALRTGQLLLTMSAAK
jgi:hypothetical protein